MIDEKISKHPLGRFVFSHTSLAFFYGLFLFLYEIKFLRIMIPVLHPVLIAWAAVLVLYDIFIRNYWKKVPFWIPIFLFTVSAGITVITTREAGLISGIKSWIIASIPLYVFYPICILSPKERRRNALLISFLGAALVIFAASTAALGLYAVRFSRYVTIGSMQELVGMRFYIPTDPSTGILLYGLYTDTNHAAIYALAFAVYGILLFVNGRRGNFPHRWQNVLAMVFGLVSALVQICYFPMANSRGGWLSLIVALFFTSFLGLFSVGLAKRKFFPKLVLSLLLSAAFTGCLLCGMFVVRSGVTRLPYLVDRITAAGTATQDPSPGAEGDPTTEPTAEPGNSQENDPMENPTGDGEISFSKNEISFDGNRFIIWGEALQVFAKRPVFGTSPSNIQYYAQKYQVGLEKIGAGTAVHNSYLDLLLDYGIVGFVLLMAFWVMCAVSVLRRRFLTTEKAGPTWYAAIFIVIITACASMTLSCTFINTTAMYFLMTVSTGYLMSDAKSSVK